MDVLSLFYFIFICYGITSIVVQSKLFRPLREFISGRSKFFGSLLSCMMCFSFWVGLFVVTLINFSPSELLYGDYLLGTNLSSVGEAVFTFLDAAFISATVYFLNIIELYIESKLPDEQ